MPPKKGRGGGGGGGGPAGPKAHQLAEEMPAGEILNDLSKGRWRVGAKLGQGGFGLIYFAAAADAKPTAEPTHVVKQEPAGNGPLALECLFYSGTMKAAKLESWARSKRVADLGLPKYVGWGMHPFKGKSNRFLVMDRFGADLQKLFVKHGTFPRVTVAQMALRLIDALHYLHDHRYVHADIKAANILLPFSKAAKQPPVKTVYLVDFGLTAKYADADATHKPYKQDPKRAHDGTVEFTSRDAHMGVAPSRRGDLEILGYCLLQWLCGRLPWEDKLADKNYVANEKIKFMKDIPSLMGRCFPGTSATTKGGSSDRPTEIQKYLQLVDELEYMEEPDYNQFKEIFKTFLRGRGISSEANIDFAFSTAAAAAAPKRASSAVAASAPKSSRPSKSKNNLNSNNNNSNNNNSNVGAASSESDEDDSMSMAFPPSRKKPAPKKAAPKKPPASSARRKAAKKVPVDDDEEDDDDDDDGDDNTVPLVSVKKSAASASAASAAASSSRSTAPSPRVAAAASSSRLAAPSSRLSSSSPRATASSSRLAPPSARVSSSSPRAAASSSRLTAASSPRAGASSSRLKAASPSCSISSASSSSRTTRKRTKADEEEEQEEEEEVGDSLPLKEVKMNDSSPTKKKPRLIKVRKNVKTADGKTQTTPKKTAKP